MQHTWDAGGNLIQRQNVKGDEAETESFTPDQVRGRLYDYLDRLTSASGLYSGPGQGKGWCGFPGPRRSRPHADHDAIAKHGKVS